MDEFKRKQCLCMPAQKQTCTINLSMKIQKKLQTPMLLTYFHATEKSSTTQGQLELMQNGRTDTS
jgi:hypothetical protein